MLKLAIPVLHVASSQVAERFYCDRLGFELRFAYRIVDDVDALRAELAAKGVTADL
jgi:hypothetical protein